MAEPAAARIGRYVLRGELAAGGMARVHLGMLEAELGFARAVAIKQLHPHYASDPEFVSMLLDEGRLACRIRHAHVVPALDIVVHEGQVALVMEYVPGESLSHLLRSARARGQQVPLGVAVALAMHVLAGLEAAHDARDEAGRPLRIVHRDVSPQNILVGEDGLARLLDFGIAKAVGRMQSTRNHELKGKLAYMAPEQLARAEVDGRADVFAASIVLWEMLTGARLFASDDEVTTCARVATLAIDAPGTLRDDVPPALDAVVMRGLARPLDARWPSAGAMAAALEATGRAASPREIAAWLRTLDTPTLALGRQLLAAPGAMSEAPRVDLPDAHPLAQVVRRAAEAEAPTRKEAAGSAPVVAQAPESAPRTRVLPSVAAALVALLGALAWVVTRGAPEVPPAPVAIETVSTARAEPAAPAAAVQNAPDVVQEAAPAVPTPAPSVAPPERRPRRTRTPRTKALAPRAPDDCAVPFQVDETGVRIPKRHCLE